MAGAGAAVIGLAQLRMLVIASFAGGANRPLGGTLHRIRQYTHVCSLLASEILEVTDLRDLNAFRVFEKTLSESEHGVRVPFVARIALDGHGGMPV